MNRRFKFLLFASSLALSALLALTCKPVSQEQTANDERITVYANAPMTIDEATLFSFDDVLIPYKQNLYIQMVPAEKYAGNPVVTRGDAGTPDEHDVKFNGSVICHEGKFRMWYVAIDKEAMQFPPPSIAPTRTFAGFRLAYAESEDGIHWVKPNLGLVEYRGSRDNNLVVIDPPEIMGNHLVVLDEPDDPDPSRRFKMMRRMRGFPLRGFPPVQLTEGYALRVHNTTVPLYSADGLRWHLAVDTDIVDYALPEEGLIFPENFEQSGFYKWQGLYYLTGQQTEPWAWLPNGEPAGRVMTVFRSLDLVNWSPTKALGFVRYGYRSAPPGHGEEAHLAGSVWNRRNVLVATYGLWHGAPNAIDRRMDIGLLISNDGIHFREPVPDFVFTKRGDPGSWDEGGLLTGQGFENVGDRTYVYYGHYDLSHPRSTDREAGRIPKPGGGVGLAMLERDRFGFLTPKDPSRPAAFVTGVLGVSDGATIWVNAEGLSREARLRIELISQLERPLPDYSGKSSAILTDSGLRSPVLWNGDDGQIRNLREPIRIRVSFEGSQRDAIKLYALYVGTEFIQHAKLYSFLN